MVGLITAILSIALTAALLFVGNNYLSSIADNKQSYEFENAVTSTLDVIGKAFEQCRRTRNAANTAYLCTSSTDGTGTTTNAYLLENSDINGLPTGNGKESLQFLQSFISGTLPRSDAFEYRVRVYVPSGQTKAYLYVCLNPGTLSSPSTSNLLNYDLFAFRRLAGNNTSGLKTGLQGFTYQVSSSSSTYTSCVERTVETTAQLSNTASNYSGYFIGATKVFVDY